MALHRDGDAWSFVDCATSDELTAVWSSGPTDTWLASSRALFHSNGRSCTVHAGATGALTLWGSSRDDVWGVSVDQSSRESSRNVVLTHYDGSAWKRATVPEDDPRDPNGPMLSGTRRDDVWCFNCGGHPWHWDGQAWTPTCGGGSLVAGYARRPNEVWGTNRPVRYKQRNDPQLLMRWNGGAWTPGITVDASSSLGGPIVAPAKDDLWAAGPGYVDHFVKGASVSRTPMREVKALAATAPDDVWAGGGRSGSPVLSHWNGGAWASLVAQGPGYRAVHGTSDANVWLVGDAGLVAHFDGASLTRASISSEHLTSVFVSSTSEAWALGSSTLFHWVAGAWEPSGVRIKASYNVMRGSGPSDIWIVGADGSVLHHNGSRWETVAANAKPPLYVQSPTNVWAAGRVEAVSTPIVHWDGVSWKSFSITRKAGSGANSAGSGVWKSIWSSGPSDVWAVADVVFHFDGAAWSEVTIPGVGPFSASVVTGTGPNDVWVSPAVAPEAGVSTSARWNGAAWTITEETPPPEAWPSGPAPWKVEENGVLRRRTP